MKLPNSEKMRHKLPFAAIGIISIVKGKGRNISSVSQRVERVGEGRIVN